MEPVLARTQGERTVCPLELRSGIIEDRWTPRAPELATFVVAHLTSQEGEDLFRKLGNATPSKSGLDRLPKHLCRRWEERRERFEADLRAAEEVPAEAVSVAASLDGVMVPMKDGQRAQKRAAARRSGKRTKDPSGYAEASCATLSFYDAAGILLSTLRFGRMPEARKTTLKTMLLDEILDVLAERPDLKLVKVADGARDNWTYLSEILPSGIEVVDFFHASEHLHVSACAADGAINTDAQAWWEKWRHILRHDDQGVERVIRALAYQAGRHPRRKKLRRELT